MILVPALPPPRARDALPDVPSLVTRSLTVCSLTRALAAQPLNYAGVVLAVIALGLYTQVKAEDPGKKRDTRTSDVPNLMAVELLPDAAGSAAAGSTTGKKILGFGMAVVAGLLFGNTFTPPDYLKDNGYGPVGPLDYIFSHYIGIFATSTLWFIVYCCYMRGSPLINPKIVLPALISGVMWGIAQASWFIANDALSVAVAFPVITSGPGIVSSLWGVFVFGEIRGRRNYLVLSFAIFLALTGCILIGISKG
jgi:hypothetical protein